MSLSTVQTKRRAWLTDLSILPGLEVFPKCKVCRHASTKEQKGPALTWTLLTTFNNAAVTAPIPEIAVFPKASSALKRN